MNFFLDLFNTIFTYPILNGLMMLYYLLGDFGLAIVVLTGIITCLLLPVTLRQRRSARVVRDLQPQISTIRQQYANDRVAQNQAIQALYKEHSIHPASSFFSMLIQVPIYSGLYVALNLVLNASSVDTINNIMYPFLVHFTSRPNANLLWFTFINASWHISLGLPDPSHLLPLLVGLVTFVQMRMAQPIPSLVETKDTLTHISQSTQFLLLLIPVAITIVIAWQFAAGLALYRFVSLILGILQQYLMTGWGSLWVVPNVEHKSAVASQPDHPLTPTLRVSRTQRPHSRRSSRQHRKHPGKRR